MNFSSEPEIDQCLSKLPQDNFPLYFFNAKIYWESVMNFALCHTIFTETS